MADSRFWAVCRESLSNIYREFKVTITPVPVGKKWLFLVGCYNSGTTLLAEMLSRHPQISALSTEGHFITDQFVKDYDVGLPRMWSKGEHLFRLTESDSGPNANRIKKEWAMRLDTSKSVFLEKSPPNSARTRWLQAHFSPAYFVAIVRNGYAVAEGISRKGDPQHLPEGWPIEDSIAQWKRNNELLLQDAPHLKHFMWLKYEDLVASPKSTIDQICHFIGLDEFPEQASAGAFSIHERKEEIRDLNAESIKRLSNEQITLINRDASDMLRHFGYPIINTGGKAEHA